MILRLFVAIGLVALVGCRGSDPPSLVSETELPAADTIVDAVGEQGDTGPEVATPPEVAGTTGNSETPASTEPPKGVATYESLMSLLQQSAQNDKFAEALKFAERALELKPGDLSALFMASQLTQRLGGDLEQEDGDRAAAGQFFIRSADYVRQMQQSGTEFSERERQYLQQVFYNEARTLAIKGEDEQALAALGEAFEAGFDGYQMIDEDVDFVELRKTPEYKQVVTVRHEEHKRRLLDKVKKQIADHKPFPFDFELVSTTGKSVKLADYKGKLLIVDFWGTWCPPCKREIPHFLELLANYQAAGLEIVGINYEQGDDAENRETINAFAKENGVTYPCLLGDDATQARVPNFDSFPTTLFIDPSGTVRLKAVGFHPYEHLEAIVQLLLAEASGSPVDQTKPSSDSNE